MALLVTIRAQKHIGRIAGTSASDHAACGMRVVHPPWSPRALEDFHTCRRSTNMLVSHSPLSFPDCIPLSAPRIMLLLMPG